MLLYLEEAPAVKAFCCYSCDSMQGKKRYVPYLSGCHKGFIIIFFPRSSTITEPRKAKKGGASLKYIL